jgi:glycosyltransferase involved in cell wall biosynthesis
MEKIFIIIPAYNETEVITETVKPLLAKGYEVVVIDDGSRTSIEQYLKGTGVHFLKHDINLGQGAALQTGMDFAKQFEPDFVVHYDADGQHSAADIGRFIELLKERKVDILLGSRFLEQETIELVPAKRRMLLRFARFVNWVFTGLFLTDAHNGFRAMRGSVLSRLVITENRMAHATEVLRIIKRNKISYSEASTKIHYTEYSMQKGQKASASVNILIDLIIHRFI